MNHTYQTVVTFLVLVHTCLFTSCGMKSRDPNPETRTAWGETAYGLRCAIEVEKPMISKSDSLIVVIRLQNVSGKRIDQNCLAAFSMAGCWCPVDLTGSNLRLCEKISLEPDQIIEFKADLSTLGWDRQESSIWPVRQFHQVVPSGNHELRLDFELPGSEPRWVRSNTVTITLTN
jgi:hypothetical protein